MDGMGKSYIKGGTPVGSESLCRTCSWSHIMSGYRESEQITRCSFAEPHMTVPFTIHECSRFYDKNRPSWQQMEKLAIHVTPTKPVGFKTGPGFSPVKVTVGSESEDEDLDDDLD